MLSLYRLKLCLYFVAPNYTHTQISFCSILNLLLRVRIFTGRVGILAKDSLDMCWILKWNIEPNTEGSCAPTVS